MALKSSLYGRFVLLVLGSGAGLKVVDALVFRAPQEWAKDELDVLYLNPGMAQSLLKNATPDAVLQKAYRVKPYVEDCAIGWVNPSDPNSIDANLHRVIWDHWETMEPEISAKAEQEAYGEGSSPVAGLPTAEDLDKVEEEKKIAEATSGAVPEPSPADAAPTEIADSAAAGTDGQPSADQTANASSDATDEAGDPPAATSTEAPESEASHQDN